MTENPVPQNEAKMSSSSPTFKDKAMGWLSKGKDAASYVGKGLEENAVSSGLTPRAGEALGLAQRGINTVGEAAVTAVDAVDRGLDRAEQGVNYVATNVDKGVDAARKGLALNAMGARIAERANTLVSKVAGRAADYLTREVGGRVDTAYGEKVAPVFDLIGKRDPVTFLKDAAGNIKESMTAKFGKKGEAKEVDPRVAEASKVLEGSKLVESVTQGMRPAVEFDQAPNQIGVAIADKFYNGLNKLVKDFVSSPDPRADEVKAKAEEIDRLKAAVIQSRGELPGVSYDHERRLTDDAEKNEVKAIELGLEIYDMLPESAADLDRSTLNVARATAIKLVTANRNVLIPLENISRSLAQRFPDKADEIGANYKAVIGHFVEDDATLTRVVDETQRRYDFLEATRKSSGELYKSLIKGNEFFSELNKDQQDAVMQDLGATRREGVTGRNIYERYDAEPNSVYDTVANAAAEYARANVTYEAIRGDVESHPEAAGRLVIAAEKVVQAKYALQLASNKMIAELTVRSKKILSKEDVKSLEASHTGQELADIKARKEYQAKMLDRQVARIKAEGPTVDKIKKFMIAAGVGIAAVVGAAEATPILVENAPQIVEALKTAYDFLQANFSNTAKAGLLAGAVSAGSILAAHLGMKIGVSAESQSKEIKAEMPASNEQAADTLGTLLASLKADDPRRADMESLLARFSN